MASDDVKLFAGEREAITRCLAKGNDGLAEAMASMAHSRTALLDALMQIEASFEATSGLRAIAEDAINEARRRATEDT
jgi:succinate dehydrogenase hydrophobic anchor subunit